MEPLTSDEPQSEDGAAFYELKILQLTKEAYLREVKQGQLKKLVFYCPLMHSEALRLLDETNSSKVWSAYRQLQRWIDAQLGGGQAFYTAYASRLAHWPIDDRHALDWRDEWYDWMISVVEEIDKRHYKWSDVWNWQWMPASFDFGEFILTGTLSDGYISAARTADSQLGWERPSDGSAWTAYVRFRPQVYRPLQPRKV